MNDRMKRMTAEEVNREMAAHGRVRSDAEMKLEKSRGEMRRVGMLLLANEDGKLLLSMLEDLYFNGSLIGADPYLTYSKCGQRDVVVFLRELRDQATKEK
jgi:hypothetical protein